MELLTAIVVVSLIIILVIGRSVRAAKKRTAALEQIARTRGYDFTSKSETDAPPSGSELMLFSAGHSRSINNILHKSSVDREEWIFDYTYTTGHGKNRSVHRQTVFMFYSGRLRLTKFVLKPEHFFHKIGQIFGYQDIDLEFFPEFSNKFLLRGKDEESIRKLFDQQVVSCFEQQKNICAEGFENTLIVYWHKNRIKPDMVFERYHEAIRIHGAFVQKSQFV